MRRRHLLQSGLAAGAALYVDLDAFAAASSNAGRAAAFGAWIRIGPGDTVTLVHPQAEMGQGIYSGFAAIVADELGADIRHMRVENAPFHPAHRHPMFDFQFTGAAASTRAFYPVLRKAAAAARELLVLEAASRWQASPAVLRVEDGRVLHPGRGLSLGFGALAGGAAKRPAPADPALRSPASFRYIGADLRRLDTPDKVSGRAQFGIDVLRPGMVHAAIRMPPVLGAAFKPHDERRASGMPGVLRVVQVGPAVAVVAEHYWQARQAMDALDLQVAPGPHDGLSQADLRRLHRQALDDGPGVPGPSHGGPAPANAQAAAYAAEYESPFQAHATMEPQTCVADVRAGRCDVWAPTQNQELAHIVVREATGLADAQIHIHRTFLGGGFGRRLLNDYVLQAVALSQAVRRPVKLIWSREEDIRNDFYRPMVMHRLEASLDAAGMPTAFKMRIASGSQLRAMWYDALAHRPGIQAAGLGGLRQALDSGYDPLCFEGLEDLEYGIAHRSSALALVRSPVPVSLWRSTGYGPNLFALESFVDELALRAGIDPYLYRRQLLAARPRALAVLDLAAQQSGWGTPVPAGRARGMAFAHAYGSLVAQVVELSADEAGTVRVHRVTTALDCGQVVNPDSVRAQVEGGAVWGITAALLSEITVKDGAIEQSNFGDFQMLRFADMPQVDTHIVASREPPGGMGELGAVPTPPAIANALFAATGRRVRALPAKPEALRKT